MISDINKGRWFAAVQFFILAFVLVFAYSWHDRSSGILWLRYSGAVITIIGIVIGLIAVFAYGQRVTPNPFPLKEAKLKTTGIYSKVRHPMYLAAIIVITGWSLMFFSVISLFFPLIALSFLIIKINFEEKQLIKKFPDYLQYKEKSYHLFPYIY